jgi:hypothetical protein
LKILCWGPLMTWGAAAPIRMRTVTQVETPWRHSDDASTDVSNPPPTYSSRVRQYAWGKWRP